MFAGWGVIFRVYGAAVYVHAQRLLEEGTRKSVTRSVHHALALEKSRDRSMDRTTREYFVRREPKQGRVSEENVAAQKTKGERFRVPPGFFD